MSEFAETVDAEVESLEDVQARHRREVRELDTKARFLLKAAKKGRAAEAETEIKRLEAELRDRHASELAAAEARDASAVPATAGTDASDSEPQAASAAADTASKASGAVAVVDAEAARREQEEAERRAIEAKKLKNKKKKDKKVEKAAEKEESKAAILQNAGPSAKQIEIDRFIALLAPENLKIVEVAADGHCLYRAVSHQLGELLQSGHTLPTIEAAAPSFAEVRALTTKHIRENRDMFEAYIEEDFDEYCRKIASVSDCVWGGQVELNALTHALRLPIWIYDTVQPVLKMGSEFGEGGHPSDPIVRLSFHRHYYSLGEHYNSVVPK